MLVDDSEAFEEDGPESQSRIHPETGFHIVRTPMLQTEDLASCQEIQ